MFHIFAVSDEYIHCRSIYNSVNVLQTLIFLLRWGQVESCACLMLVKYDDV